MAEGSPRRRTDAKEKWNGRTEKGAGCGAPMQAPFAALVCFLSSGITGEQFRDRRALAADEPSR